MCPQQNSLGEKTEQATPRRKREAREKGQVFKSVEINSAFSLLVMFGTIWIFGHVIIRNIQELLVYFFSGNHLPDVISISTISNAMLMAVIYLIRIMIPLFAAAVLAGLVFNMVQVGFIFSSKAAQPKMDRINPISGFKRIFSTRTIIELVKSIIKLVVIVWVAYSGYRNRMVDFPGLMGEEVPSAASAFFNIIINIAFRVAIAFAIFAPFDYIYQRWKYNKDLMMTKQEVKDEYKLTEGNPQIKSKISQKQRQMSRMRMIQAVSDADVVITNPTHYAVALAYEENKNTAPMVVAKGMDYLAQKMKEKAREEDVTIVENKPLAQSLYFFCDVGEEVPEDMYKAVAEILAYVYNLKRRGGRA